jgi:hypothetical protein
VIDLLRERQEIAGAEHGLALERLAQAEQTEQHARADLSALEEKLRTARAAAGRLSDENLEARSVTPVSAAPCTDAPCTDCTIARQDIELGTLKNVVRQQAEQIQQDSTIEAHCEVLKTKYGHTFL